MFSYATILRDDRYSVPSVYLNTYIKTHYQDVAWYKSCHGTMMVFFRHTDRLTLFDYLEWPFSYHIGAAYMDEVTRYVSVQIVEKDFVNHFEEYFIKMHSLDHYYNSFFIFYNEDYDFDKIRDDVDTLAFILDGEENPLLYTGIGIGE